MRLGSAWSSASRAASSLPGWAREALIIGLPLAAFLVLLFAAPHTRPTEFDRQLTEKVQEAELGPFAFVPHLGSQVGGGVVGLIVAPPLVIGLALWRRDWALVLMVVPFVLAYLVGAEIKDHVTAYRPSPEFGVEGPGGGRSFPSGHVAWAVLFWGFLATLLSRGLSRRDRWMVLTVVVILVGATALGRVHLGRHWPLDTLAGALIGLAGLRVMVLIHGLLESFTARAGAGAVAGWRDPGYAPLRETTDRSTR